MLQYLMLAWMAALVVIPVLAVSVLAWTLRSRVALLMCWPLITPFFGFYAGAYGARLAEYLAGVPSARQGRHGDMAFGICGSVGMVTMFVSGGLATLVWVVVLTRMRWRGTDQETSQ